MKVAIMQPYFFPYLGYFQLIHAVDIFVFYDDVNFITRGWINRNRILVNKKEYLFSIPIADKSQFKKIYETYVAKELFPKWRKKFLKTLETAYKKTPYFHDIIGLIESVLTNHSGNISELAINSIKAVTTYLDVKTGFMQSSEKFAETIDYKKEERLIKICQLLHASEYINLIGGIQLYDKTDFKNAGIELRFLKSHFKEYKQFAETFHPGLSMIDVLMFNSPEEIVKMLNDYEFL